MFTFGNVFNCIALCWNLDNFVVFSQFLVAVVNVDRMHGDVWSERLPTTTRALSQRSNRQAGGRAILSPGSAATECDHVRSATGVCRLERGRMERGECSDIGAAVRGCGTVEPLRYLCAS